MPFAYTTTPISIEQYTTEIVEGTGVFDIMMRSVNAQVNKEYSANRIKGAEYATVYLAALQSTMERALEFLLARDKVSLEAELLKLEAQKLEFERDKMESEAALMAAQVLKITTAEIPNIQANTSNIIQDTANKVIEGTVLVAQECKLRAEFDLLVEQKLKAIAETGLLTQKEATERAQTNGAGITADSVLGKQNILYGRQADGFLRDAEQKAAKIMVDSWAVRRTTDDTTQGSVANSLSEADIKAVVDKMKEGI